MKGTLLRSFSLDTTQAVPTKPRLEVQAPRLCPTTQKIRYDTCPQARRALAQLPPKVFEERLHTYKCPTCGSYHIGNQRQL